MENTSSKPVTNRSMPQSTVIPVLGYTDVTTAIQWLCETFGFKERWRAGGHRAQLTIGDGAVVLSVQTSPFVCSLMIRIPDVDQHFEHTRQQGAKIVQAPMDYPYGERQYTAEDPGGHQWTFSQSIADITPEDWGGTTAAGVQLAPSKPPPLGEA